MNTRMTTTMQRCTGMTTRSDVLMQLSAVIGALQSIAKVILKDHLDHCVVDAVQSGDTQTLDDFKKAIDRYIR